MRRGGILLVVCLTGCASGFVGARQRIPVTSEPAGASVHLVCEGFESSWGVTPTSILISPEAERCSVTIAKKGYDPATVTLVRRFTSEPASSTVDEAITAAALIGAGLLHGGGIHVSLPVNGASRSVQHSKQVPEEIEVVLQPEAERRP